MQTGETKVIVATEHEQTVRLYVGVPQNGGMDQVGQFVNYSELNPTDLANMAVDLSAQFGWLAIRQSDSKVPTLHANAAPAIVALPPGTLPPGLTHKDRLYLESVECPECKKPMMRGSVAKHLRNVHGWRGPQPTQMEHDLPTITSKHPQPTMGKDKWKQIVGCPMDGCTSQTTRSNMQRHLTTALHGMRPSDAAQAVRDLPAVAPAVPRKATRHNRQGPYGTRILETEILPDVLARITSGETTAQIAKRHRVIPSTVQAWCRKLEARGQIMRLPRQGKTERIRWEPVEPTNELQTEAQR